jgi:hypothetical protein
MPPRSSARRLALERSGRIRREPPTDPRAATPTYTTLLARPRLGQLPDNRLGHLLCERTRSSPFGPEDRRRSAAGAAGGPGSTIAARAPQDHPPIGQTRPTTTGPGRWARTLVTDSDVRQCSLARPRCGRTFNRMSSSRILAPTRPGLTSQTLRSRVFRLSREATLCPPAIGVPVAGERDSAPGRRSVLASLTSVTRCGLLRLMG